MDPEDRLLQERLDKLKASDDPIPSETELLERLNRLKNVQIQSEVQTSSQQKFNLIKKDKRSTTQKVDDLLKELNCEVKLDREIRNVTPDTVTLKIIRDDDDSDDNDSEVSSLLNESTESEILSTSESELSESESESSLRSNQRKTSK